jgi:hypothetical protein
MFDSSYQLNQITRLAVKSDRNAWVHESAVSLFRHARAGANWRRFVAFFRRRSAALLELNLLRKTLRLRGEHYAGVQTVTLCDIIGSEARARDFDAGFAPTAERLASRWQSVAVARILGISLPPVKLIQIGDAYFVRDGHHRLSVARSLGEDAIEAEVTVWDTAEPLPWQAHGCIRKLAVEPA